MKMLPSFIGFAITSFFVMLLNAQDAVIKFEKLTTTNGKEYTSVTVKEVTPAGIKIMHSSGAATLPYQNLTKEIQDQLGGFDPEKAAIFLKEQSARDIKNAQHAEALHAASVRAEKAKQQSKVDFATAQKGVVEIISVTRDGALCKIGWEIEVKTKIPKRDAFGREYFETQKKKAVAEYQDAPIFIHGLAGVVDGEIVAVAIKRLEDSYSYTNVAGAAKTVAAYKLIARS